MAYLRRHNRSPFFYLVARDLETGEWKEVSTRLRADDPKQARKAQRKADDATALEMKVAPISAGAFATWVPQFISSHYRRASTRERQEAAWLNVFSWLRARGIRHPQEVRYEHSQDYMAWRTGSAKHNTARLEFKFLSFLMQEAVRRDLCERNPLAGVRIERDVQPEKPELSDDDIVKTRAALARQPEWMQIVFEILISTGCRFAEASIPMSRIDFERGVMQLEDSKRKAHDAKKFFSVEMDYDLVDYLKGLSERDRTVPALDRMMNRAFNRVLKRAAGVTSHSCRVTFISRCHAEGLSEMEVMKLVNHSSRLVHQIYSRKHVQSLRAARSRVKLPRRIADPARPAPIESSSSCRSEDTLS